MPKSAFKWKRTENETQNAWTKFQKTGSPLERQLTCLSGPLRPAKKNNGCMKNKLERWIGRSSGRLVKIAPMLERQSHRSSGYQVCKKYWEPAFPARALGSPLEQPSKFWKTQNCVLELHFDFQPAIHACYGSNYTFTHANMLLIQDYDIRKLNFMIHLHACPKISQTHHQHAQIQTFKTYTPMICTRMPILTSHSFQIMQLVLIAIRFNKDMLACGITLPIFHNITNYMLDFVIP